MNGSEYFKGFVTYFVYIIHIKNFIYITNLTIYNDKIKI